jgi:hypothetical protein
MIRMGIISSAMQNVPGVKTLIVPQPNSFVRRKSGFIWMSVIHKTGIGKIRNGV